MSESAFQGVKPSSLLIGGDVVPTASNAERFSEGDICHLVDGGIRGVFESAGFRALNLETPLVDEESPIEKCGPALSARTSSVRGLTALGIDAVALANNHIMDQGARGLSSTISALDGADILHFGAGQSLGEARLPLVVEIGTQRVGVYACAEHEFSIAGEEWSGANPFDPLASLQHVRELRGKCDIVVALYHGGKEHYRYPSPLLRARCRALVDAGANVVVCQHSHCVGCEESWHEGTIVYGQGNFLFDHQDNEFWATGLLVEVDFDDGACVRYHPIVKDGASVRLANTAEAREIMKGFQERSEQIKVPGFVEEECRRYARSCLNGYLLGVMPGARSLPFRVLNKLCGGNLAERLYGRQTLLALQNYVECEAHNELLAEGIKAKMEGIDGCPQ